MLDFTQQAKLIENKHDFIELIRVLANYLNEHPIDQSDLTVTTYLQSIAAWTNDMDGYYLNRNEEPPQNPTWRTLGEIIVAALYYE